MNKDEVKKKLISMGVYDDAHLELITLLFANLEGAAKTAEFENKGDELHTADLLKYIFLELAPENFMTKAANIKALELTYHLVEGFLKEAKEAAIENERR